MLRSHTLRILKISLIVLSLAGCEHVGNLKIYNVESENEEDRPGLIRRDEDGNMIDWVTFDEAHTQYGCMSWEDVDAVLEMIKECKKD